MSGRDYMECFDNGFISYSDEGRKRPDCYEMSEYLVKEHGLKCIDKYNWIYSADKKHYELISDEVLANKVISLTNRKAPMRWVSQFLKTIKYDSQYPISDFVAPEGFLNVENGILDVRNNKLLERKRGSFKNFKYCSPIYFDKDAKCPNFLAFLRSIFLGNEELVNLTAEVYGYCLLGGYPWLHKAFILYGDGRNGKSTWQYALRSIIGSENVASVPMDLLGKPFSAVQLDGALINMTGESPTGHVESHHFKEAIGGDVLNVAKKGKDEYPLKVTSRFVFATNNLPRFQDASTGMWEKLYIVPFPKYITKAERNADIYRQIDMELPGILNFAVEGAKRLVKRGRLPEIMAVEDMLNEYRSDSDSVFDFYRTNIAVSEDAGDDWILNKKVHSLYLRYCSANDFKHPLGVRSFSQRLERIFKEAEMLNFTVQSKKSNQGKMWKGFSVNNNSNY